MTQSEDICVVDLKNIGLEKLEKQKKLKAKFKIIYNTEMDVDIQVDLLKMYCIVLKQLSPIQKGIQAAHSIVEYQLQNQEQSELYDAWAKYNKTIVILNASDSKDLKGVERILQRYHIPYGSFRETSLDGILTSICFLYERPPFEYNKDVDYAIDGNDSVMEGIVSKRHLAN